MFIGQYNHTIDTKGRLSIPSKFREQLGDEFVITRGMDGCLFAYDKDNWNELHEKLKDLPNLSKEAARFLYRYFFTGAMEVEVDKQGRILLPASLRAIAKLERNVVLAGVGDCIEIWDEEKWNAIEETMNKDNVTAALDQLGLMI